MKTFILYYLFLVGAMLLYCSCKKEIACAGCGNIPPKANAGTDQTITLPANTALLDGTGSADPDNDIKAYLWSKISGPLSFIISDKDVVKTEVKSLVEGIYEFELKVTDAGGLASTDTVQIRVIDPLPTVPCAGRPVININFLPIGNLSEARAGLSSGTVAGKIVFAGGWVPYSHYSSTVDIYDIAINTWSTAALSIAEREGMAVASVGNKILFAGGGDNDNGLTTSRVDIYDAGSDIWSIAELSMNRQYLAGATLGNEVFFSGGNTAFTYSSEISDHASDRIDIYDNATNTWSITSLSTGRDAPSATTIGNKIYVAGGLNYNNLSNWQVLESIDVYDGVSGTWSISSLQGDSRMRHASIAVGNKIFFASGAKNAYSGGLELSDNVEILDITTGISSFACINPKTFFHAVTKNEDIIFFTGNSSNSVNDRIDIYNTATDTWSVGLLPFSIYSSTVISVNNTVYVAGGYVNGTLSDQVWKLEF